MLDHTAFHDNFLLAMLGPADLAAIGSYLEPVALPVGLTLYEAGGPVEAAYFPAQGIVSIVSELDQGTVEVGTVGREGMLGTSILLYTPRTTCRAFMQVAGHGWRCTSDELLGATAASPALSRLLYRYIHAFMDQVSQSVACNRLHTLEERCARWLLMVHDGVEGDVLSLKQAFIADMLGVHRPAVTLAAGALQNAGLIAYSRGKVHVLDRAGLEGAACACYAIVRHSFDLLRSGAPAGRRATSD